MATRKRAKSDSERAVNIDTLIAKALKQDRYLLMEDIIYNVSDRVQDEIGHNIEDVVRDRVSQVFDEAIEKLTEKK